MTSFVSEAIAEISEGLSEEAMMQQTPGSTISEMQAKHRGLIAGILPKVSKIQKEMKGRRFWDVQTKLTNAVKLLTRFQDQEWPPRELPPAPEWMGGPNSETSREIDATENGEEATVTTAAESTDDETSKATAQQQSLEEASLTELVTSLDDYESQTTEPMHDAINESIEAFVMVLTHPRRTNKAVEATLECLTVLLVNRYVTGRAGGKDALSAAAAAAEPKTGNGTKLPPPSLLHQLIEGVTKCSESSLETVQIGVVKTMLALMISPKTGVHEASMLMAIRATFHVYLITKSEECKKIAKDALYDMLRSVFNRMEAIDTMLPNCNKEEPEPKPEEAEDTDEKESKVSSATLPEKADFSKFPSQYHTDSYLLFRALCKLSSKTLAGDEGSKSSSMMGFVTPIPVDPLALNSKILSLELLRVVLEYAGSAFCNSEKFVYAVQNYLCVSLLKNCMSTNTQVAYYSLKIFLMLIYKFKSHLKSEIEVFMSNIFLRVLDSPNSSFEQKALVLEALRALCSDPSLLTQLFLNYDCDMDANNLYKDIVHDLTKLSAKATAAPISNMTKKEIEQDFELSLAGVEVLVSILKAFLKALNLPGGEDEEEGDSAALRLLQSLQIDVGMAAKPVEKKPPNESSHGDDGYTAKDFSKNEASSQERQTEKASSEASKIVDAFETKQLQEQNFKTGQIKFNLSLKSGLKFFIDHGFVDLDAKQIALFFLEHKDELDKTQMGEALGREPDSSFVKGDSIDPEQGGPGFWFRILNHYVDSFDFTGLQFDDAIRLFQSGFRLPGEAQKIDRIMEKFAEHYTRQNIDVFPSADTAFILAFSVIMLNTDLHNPNIKEEKKMTLESFIRNNRGIADGEDLPKEFLKGIFQRIKSNPFTLKEDDEAREKLKKQEMNESAVFFEGTSIFGTSTEERKREKFKKEREEMVNSTQELFKNRQGRKKAVRAAKSASMQLTESINPGDVVKPMFDVTWGPLIGTLSQVLECSDDERSIATCLNGFVYAVRIAAHSDRSLARDTFVNSLAKFTFLGSIKEMKHKNIESIRTLLSIAVIDGEYLGASWGPVLQCISQLARLRLFASGLESDEALLTNGAVRRENGHENGVTSNSKSDIEREAEENNSRAVVAAFNEVLIDKVFTSTVNLSARSITHFIEQLVEVSAMEIAGNSKRGITGVGASTRTLSDSKDKKFSAEEGPRIFSLQRLVEVADYNMDVRPRLAWAQVWEIMADHFAKIGMHQNSSVSIFAIDSLRQLSFKFLEKPERSEFNFQRIFLRPFLQIMENSNTREDIRELILRCMDNMIRTMSHNIRSGWKIFFSILAASANDLSERINTLGLAILQRLLDEHLHQLCRLSGDEEATSEDTDMNALEKRNRNANVEDFVGLCRASLAFVQTKYSTSPLPIGLSMRALCHTACYADLLADERVLPAVSGAQTSDPDVAGYTYNGLSDKEALEMALWRTLLDGLTDGIRSTNPSSAGGVGCLVQRGSVLALRATLLRHGHRFSIAQWSVILDQSLLPAIQDAAESDKSPVILITSESPTVSSLDFLVEPQGLPPSHGDEGLLKFAEQASGEESAPSRPLGQAELLVEASFTDMRHGGDGNLSRAHELAKKDIQARTTEQPFPNSWIATTAPIALGTLTDMTTEIFVSLGAEGREKLWPLILRQFELWSIGRFNDDEGSGADLEWRPCEALVRIATRELHRLSRNLLDSVSDLSSDERIAWSSSILKTYANIISTLVSLESQIIPRLIDSKLKAYGISSEEDDDNEDNTMEVIMYTEYGRGKLLEKRDEVFKVPEGGYCTVMMNVIKLEFGATLYRPALGTMKFHEAPKIDETVTPKSKRQNGRMKSGGSRKSLSKLDSMKGSWWEVFLPQLKIRCVGVYCLQRDLQDLVQPYLSYVGKDVVEDLLEALNSSRRLSDSARVDVDLMHAFKEAIFSEWDDSVEEEVESSVSIPSRFANKRGSEMFFLTQEACAADISVRLLALLFKESMNEVVWERENFSESLLLENVVEVLRKFTESESKDGHLIDPNVWRKSSESGGKVALYCTSFALVVVNILNVILDITPEQFQRHVEELYPILTSLVVVQSDEIRSLVKEILNTQVARLLQVKLT